MKRTLLVCLLSLLSFASAAQANYPNVFHSGTSLVIPLRQLGKSFAGATLLVYPTGRPLYGCSQLVIYPYPTNRPGWLMANLSSTTVYSTTRTTIVLRHPRHDFDAAYPFLEGWIYAAVPGTYRVVYQDLPARFCPPPTVSNDEFDQEPDATPEAR